MAIGRTPPPTAGGGAGGGAGGEDRGGHGRGRGPLSNPTPPHRPPGQQWTEEQRQEAQRNYEARLAAFEQQEADAEVARVNAAHQEEEAAEAARQEAEQFANVQTAADAEAAAEEQVRGQAGARMKDSNPLAQPEVPDADLGDEDLDDGQRSFRSGVSIDRLVATHKGDFNLVLKSLSAKARAYKGWCRKVANNMEFAMEKYAKTPLGSIRQVEYDRMYLKLDKMDLFMKRLCLVTEAILEVVPTAPETSSGGRRKTEAEIDKVAADLADFEEEMEDAIADYRSFLEKLHAKREKLASRNITDWSFDTDQEFPLDNEGRSTLTNQNDRNRVHSDPGTREGLRPESRPKSRVQYEEDELAEDALGVNNLLATDPGPEGRRQPRHYEPGALKEFRRSLVDTPHPDAVLNPQRQRGRSQPTDHPQRPHDDPLRERQAEDQRGANRNAPPNLARPPPVHVPARVPLATAVNPEAPADSIWQQQMAMMSDMVLRQQNVLDKILDKQQNPASWIKLYQQQNRVKPPELTHTNFGGESLEFPTFWSRFYEMVDHNDLISNAEKVMHLQGCMKKGSVAETVFNSFRVTADNYDGIVRRLKQRFGNRRIMTNSLVQTIMYKPKSQNVKEAAKLVDFLQAQVHQLEEFGIEFEDRSTNAILLPVIESKLPTEIIQKWEVRLMELEEKATFNSQDPLPRSAPHVTMSVEPKVKDFLKFIDHWVKAANTAYSYHNYGGDKKKEEKKQVKDEAKTEEQKKQESKGQFKGKKKQDKPTSTALIVSTEDAEEAKKAKKKRNRKKKPTTNEPDVQKPEATATSDTKGKWDRSAWFQKDCLWCGKAHSIVRCVTYKSFPMLERWERLRHYTRKQVLCYLCMTPGHKVSECEKDPCKDCGKRHHAQFHETPPVNRSNGTAAASANSD